jgi:hypothetical protein
MCVVCPWSAPWVLAVVAAVPAMPATPVAAGQSAVVLLSEGVCAWHTRLGEVQQPEARGSSTA